MAGTKRKGLRQKPEPLVICGAPERIRTSDLRIRSPALYPAELRAQLGNNSYLRASRQAKNVLLAYFSAGLGKKVQTGLHGPDSGRSLSRFGQARELRA